jgi:hypothetical protein
MPEADPLYGDLPFRIRIGVVGAASLPHVDAIAPAVRWVLTHVIPELLTPESRAAVAHAQHTSLVYGLVGSLDSDAGRLVAEEVRRHPHCPIGYVRHDTQAPRANESGEPFAEHAEGRATVNRCDVLVAIWDEDKTAQANSEIVRVVEHARALQRPLITIPTKAPHSERTESGSGIDATPLAGIERFNALPISRQQHDEAVRGTFKRIFIAPDCSQDEEFRETTEVAEAAKQLIRERLLPFLARAERMASNNQHWYLNAGRSAYVLAPVTVAAVTIATLFPNRAVWGFGVEWVLLVGILTVVVLTNSWGVRRKWIESRFLAEQLRAAVFLTAAGVPVSRVRALPHTATESRAHEWMLWAFDEIRGRLGPLEPGWGRPYREVQAFINRAWIQEQIGYHEGKRKHAKLRNEVLEYAGFGVFLSAVIAAGWHFVLALSAATAHGFEHQALTFVALVFPALGASIGGLRAHREYSRIAKRSNSMVKELIALQRESEEIDSRVALERFLAETEALMLREAKEWLSLMSTVRLHA